MTVKALVTAASLLLASSQSQLLPHSQLQAQQLSCLKTCQVNSALINLISQFEGYSPFIYKDAVGNPTIGYGHLIAKGETFKEPLLPQAADDLLRRDLSPKADTVNKVINRPLYEGQFNALVSFTYNVGSGNLLRSTLLKKVNAKDDKQVPPEFIKWATADGHYLPGLAVRRQTEARIYEQASVFESVDKLDPKGILH